MEYYVFATEAEAQACLDEIHGTGLFPVVGQVDGVDAPDNQNTLEWQPTPRELTSGEWSVMRVPEAQLDFHNIPQANRDAFIAAHGQDIRTLTPDDFVDQAGDLFI